MVGDQNVFFIQKDASSFPEFEISEFEISRVDCTCISFVRNPFIDKRFRPFSIAVWNMKNLHQLAIFSQCVVLEANRLEPRSGHIYVGLDLGSSLFATVQNNDRSLSLLKGVRILCSV